MVHQTIYQQNIPDEQGESNQDLDFQVQINKDEKLPKKSEKSDIEKFQSNNLQVVKPAEHQQDLQEEKPANSEFVFQFFHICFKVLALAFFFLLNSVVNNTIAFIVVVLLNAFDFWTVKNLTGRKLVGLRWWSEVKDDGSESWYYECQGGSFVPNECNSNVFWFVQTIVTLIWLLITFIDLISFSFFWCLLAFIGLILAGLNFIGFYKCRGEHQKKAKNLVASLGMKVIQRSL